VGVGWWVGSGGWGVGGVVSGGWVVHMVAFALHYRLVNIHSH